MAIVFISPKAKQRVFFKVATTLIILILVVVSLVLLIIWLVDRSQSMLAQTPVNQPDVAINFNIIDSDRVKNLEPFYNLETEFTYVVTDKSGRQIQGNISATTLDDAKTLLEGSGFKVISLKEITIGRSQPFISY